MSKADDTPSHTRLRCATTLLRNKSLWTVVTLVCRRPKWLIGPIARVEQRVQLCRGSSLVTRCDENNVRVGFVSPTCECIAILHDKQAHLLTLSYSSCSCRHLCSACRRFDHTPSQRSDDLCFTPVLTGKCALVLHTDRKINLYLWNHANEAELYLIFDYIRGLYIFIHERIDGCRTNEKYAAVVTCLVVCEPALCLSVLFVL